MVIGITLWAYGGGLYASNFAYIALAVLVISAVMTGVNMLAERQPMLTHAEPPLTTQPPVSSPPTAKFVERLPPKLRGAALYAVESQDHYLRLHTSRGCDLILMRLSDALTELEGIEGAQVHRSWWVAREAVVGAQRADGRAVLTLPSGEAAPVSRTFVKALREAGWF